MILNHHCTSGSPGNFKKMLGLQFLDRKMTIQQVWCGVQVFGGLKSPREILLCSLGKNHWAGLPKMKCLFCSGVIPHLALVQAPPFLNSGTRPAPLLFSSVLNFHGSSFPCLLHYSFKHRFSLCFSCLSQTSPLKSNLSFLLGVTLTWVLPESLG